MASSSSLSLVKADSLQVTSTNQYLTAGKENQLSIQLMNIGDNSVFDIQSVLSSSISSISIIEGSQKVYTEIEEGQSKSYSPIIYVDKTLPLGSYTLTLTINYRKSNSQLESSIVNIGIVINKAYTPKLGFIVDQDNISAVAGDNNLVS